MRSTPLIAVLTLALLVALPLARVAGAQGTARSLDIDTSIRAAGMGGASAGVWWGEPNVWGNPASLAEVHGAGWVDGRTRLVPGLPADIWLKSSRLLLGGAGVGLSLMGEPLDGIGHERLDYGTNELTDQFGNPIGTFDSFEATEAWGIGVSPIQLLDAIRHAGGAAGASGPRRIDLAGGYQHKHTLIALAPSVAGGEAEADCKDWGVSGRIALTSDLSPEAPWHMEVSGGYAVLNANDAQFDFGALGSAPPSRNYRGGFAMHLSRRSPWSTEGAPPPNWVLSGMPQVFELGWAKDWGHVDAGGSPPGYDVDRFGVEGTVLGVLTGRIGHVTDRLEDIVGDTWGFGARIPIGPWASVAYDRASVPQARGSGLPNVTRQGWSLWLDPLRITSDLFAER
jgi:hypothetical protein